MKNFKLIFLFLFLLVTNSIAQQFGDIKILNVKSFISQDKIVPGQTFTLAIELDINEGLHINSNKPTEEFLIPTELTFNAMDGFSFDRVVYPSDQMRSFAFSEKKLAVYEGSVRLFTLITLSPDLKSGPQTISGKISYQGCDANTCFAPAEDSFSINVDVVNDANLVKPINQDIFKNSAASANVASSGSFTSDELKARQILERGLLFAVFAFFGIGLALNLTPCVYPIIPITVGYFGGQKTQTKTANFINALFYLIGIAIAFAILGLVSGLAGKQWGFLFQSPWFVVVISTIILAMAASLFGAFEIAVPSFLLSKVGNARQGVTGSFIMGLTVGIVIAPCAAGIIIGLVGLVAKLGLVVKGTLLFFIMGLGLGTPYLILATFSGLLDKLPQSGMWMVWIKKLFGILLVGVAIYFLMPQIERVYNKLGFTLGLLGIFAGLFLGFLDHSPGYSRAFKIGRAIFGILLIVLGTIWTNNAIHSKASDMNWVKYENQSIESLLSENKPVFIDFYADWCAPCKQLDRETFTDPSILEISKSFNMIKVDCTIPDANTKALMNKYNVTGMPTLVFLSKSGKELTDLREIGFVGPEKFITSFQKALSAL